MAGTITQYPSPRHPAIDIACKIGDPVVAAHSGQLFSERNYFLGNVATIRGTKHTSVYAHLNSVVTNRAVIAGEKIGECGNTGEWSTGPHLHFSLE